MLRDEGPLSNVAMTREIVAGVSVLAVAGITVTAFVPPADVAGRVLVTAVVSGALAAAFTDWRARTVVAVISVFVVVAVWGGGEDAQAAAGSPWSYTPLIGLATLLGVGYRRIARSPHRGHGLDGCPDKPSSHL